MVFLLPQWDVPTIYEVLLPIIVLLGLVHVIYEFYGFIFKKNKFYRIFMSCSIISILGFLLQIIMFTTPVPGHMFSIEKSVNELIIISLFLLGMLLNASTVYPIYKISEKMSE